LGKIGRIKINKKLYQKEFWTTNRELQPEDLLGAANRLLKIKYGCDYKIMKK
jgi:hypothetical protein